MSHHLSRSQRRLPVWTVRARRCAVSLLWHRAARTACSLLDWRCSWFYSASPFPAKKNCLRVIRFPFFRDVTQHRTVVTHISGQNIGPIVLQMEQTGCPETSVNSHHSTLRETPVELRAQKCLFNDDIKSWYYIVSMELCWSDAVSRTEGLGEKNCPSVTLSATNPNGGMIPQLNAKNYCLCYPVLITRRIVSEAHYLLWRPVVNICTTRLRTAHLCVLCGSYDNPWYCPFNWLLFIKEVQCVLCEVRNITLDRLIDYVWVRDLTVPMHLGLN